jgi:site-specific recombinase XerD
MKARSLMPSSRLCLYTTSGIGSHVLRHTFCSHLAMRGAPPKAIQELAGHSTLSMTLRYMHLAPSALREAIALLNFGQPVGSDERTAFGMT